MLELDDYLAMRCALTGRFADRGLAGGLGTTVSVSGLENLWAASLSISNCMCLL